MTEPTPQERQQIDEIQRRILQAFGEHEVTGDLDWDICEDGVTIRRGDRVYQLRGETLVKVDNTDPRRPQRTVVHPDGTQEHST
jgi:hypothetical protein